MYPLDADNEDFKHNAESTSHTTPMKLSCGVGQLALVLGLLLNQAKERFRGTNSFSCVKLPQVWFHWKSSAELFWGRDGNVLVKSTQNFFHVFACFYSSLQFWAKSPRWQECHWEMPIQAQCSIAGETVWIFCNKELFVSRTKNVFASTKGRVEGARPRPPRQFLNPVQTLMNWKAENLQQKTRNVYEDFPITGSERDWVMCLVTCFILHCCKQ